MMRRAAVMLIVLSLLAAACGDESESADEAAAETAAAEAAAFDEALAEWDEHVPGGDCQCADGSEFSYWSRTASPDKVLLYFQGGGACFSEETCSFTDGDYVVQADGASQIGEADGIFDFANAANPFADWSVVFVPYCTGDVHIGDNVHEYADDLTVNHVGFTNARAGLDHVVENFGGASEVVVAGSSAGGVPSPLFGGLVADELPAARVAVLADASGGYPDNPPVNAAIGGLWGTFGNVPDWPVNEGLTPQDWSIPGLFTQAGLHDPDIRMARYDNAYDDVQKEFTELAGLPDADVLDVIEANEADIEAQGVPVHSYLAPGTDHTILGSDDLYTVEVEGVPFVRWLTRYVGGEDVGDVTCTDCGEPGPDDEADEADGNGRAEAKGDGDDGSG